jgi:hypothetical protein
VRVSGATLIRVGEGRMLIARHDVLLPPWIWARTTWWEQERSRVIPSALSGTPPPLCPLQRPAERTSSLSGDLKCAYAPAQSQPPFALRPFWPTRHAPPRGKPTVGFQSSGNYPCRAVQRASAWGNGGTLRSSSTLGPHTWEIMYLNMGDMSPMAWRSTPRST